MSYVFLVILIALWVQTGHGSSAGANQPNPLIEHNVSVKGQIQCGRLPAKNVSVALLLVDFDNVPRSTTYEELREMYPERDYKEPVPPPGLVQGNWYYGTIDDAGVDEEGRYEVGGKVLVAGKDDRRFAYQLGLIHYCKNGTHQPEQHTMMHFATVRFVTSSKKPDVYDFDLANHFEPRDPSDPS